MKKSLLSAIVGLCIGGAATYAWMSQTAATVSTSFDANLSKKDDEISRLRANLATARSSAESLRLKFEMAGVEEESVVENQLDIQRLLNDARPLLKSLSLMFGDQRKKMTERMIRGMAEKLAEQMGLTEDQTKDLIAHFLKLDEENFAKIKEMLDRKLTIFDVFTVMKDMNPQKSMDAYVMDKMTEAQKKAYENQKLETKAQQLERTANWQLERMTKNLNLDEGQKDRVFDILVKKNPQYDASLAVEGVNVEPDKADAGKTQDEAIAAVLREDQMDSWKTMQERQQNEKKRWTDALGGFDPTQFLQGMGGGFGGAGRRGR